MYSITNKEIPSNVSKIDKVLCKYSMLQIIERMYNNHYRSVFWPLFIQVGVFSLCISAALCLSKWNQVSNDPRVIVLFVTVLNCSMICIFCPYCASKVNTASRLFLTSKSRFNIYLRKRISSKRKLAIEISNNFIDSKFPLTVSMFCVSNIFSLLIIFRKSN